MASDGYNRLQIYRKQAAALLSIRQSNWDPHWREISANLLPRRSRFLGDARSGANTGFKLHQSIIDSTALDALDALSSGMQSSITSPARPWFKLTVRDRKLRTSRAVKRYLDEVEVILRESVFAKSNMYQSVHTLYGDLAGFGTGVMLCLPDEKTVMRCTVLPIGSYSLDTDALGRVNTCVRTFSLTVHQAAIEYGEENLHEKTRARLQSDPDGRINITHTIRPNEMFHEGSKLKERKRFSSCYFEDGCADTDTLFLRESGFDVFPVLAPRWLVTSDEDAYGNGPGMKALGDIKQLQFWQKLKARAVEKAVDPPLQGPSELDNRVVATLPGSLTTVSNTNKKIEPIYQVQLDTQPVLEDIGEIQRRINSAFFASLFLLNTQSDRRQITAAEINAREQEKLLQLGPVLERLTPELLNPLIDLGLEYGARNNLFPPPPSEMSGADLDIEHISILAQAQKLAGVASIERYTGYVANIIAITKDPTVADGTDWAAATETYGDALSVPAKIIRPKQEVAQIRAVRQQAQQAQHAVTMAQGVASTAKDLAQTPLDQDTALSRLVGGNAL